MQQTVKRKKDHLQLFRSSPVDARWATTLLECVTLVHNALPELSFDEIDCSVEFAGRRFKSPFFITGITGGTDEALEINRALARAAERFGIGFGLGSQRAMLENPNAAKSYSVRSVAPDAFIAGNIGGVQLLSATTEKILRLVEDIGADAICVHLNPAQEMMQPEGDRSFKGITEAIKRLVTELPLPVIVKETGAGISGETAIKLKGCGVKYIDIAGVGGTSWVGVELMRSNRGEDNEARAFWDWGIPTAAAIIESSGLEMEIIASGGIRNGLDAAKAVALGARLAGIASPVLCAYYHHGEEGVNNMLEGMVNGLKTAMMLTGSGNIADFKKARRVIRGQLREWSDERFI